MIGIGTGMGAAPMRVPMPIIGAQLVLEHVANYAPYPPPTRVHAYDSTALGWQGYELVCRLNRAETKGAVRG